MASIKRGQHIELEIEKFADKGKSLARVDGFVVFVHGAVPGDRVRAYVFKKKKSYAEAKIDEVLKPSDLRTTPRCRYADECGGCKWQHVTYEAQLDAKRQSVEETFAYQSDFSDIEVPPVLGCEEPYRYRNKMDFDFSADRWLTAAEIDTGKDFDTDFAVGLHVPGNFFKVLDLEECHLPSAVTPKAAQRHPRLREEPRLGAVGHPESPRLPPPPRDPHRRAHRRRDGEPRHERIRRGAHRGHR